jgi:polysulfide reductase-like protein
VSGQPNGRHKGERSVVPDVEFESYYGRQILKTPTWQPLDIAGYLFLGGLAGASGVLAEGAAWTGRPGLERVARIAAVSGVGLGTVGLVHDLGRPSRFVNMLRVLKPTSPMSVGSFILAPFAGLSTAALASNLTGRLPVLGRAAGLGAGLCGPALATYTAALISDTAVPSWHEGHREMPFVFAGSASSAAGGLALVLAPAAENGPARRMAVGGAALELASGELMKRRMGLAAEPLRSGGSGRMMKAAEALTAVGALGSLVGRSRPVAALAGACLVAGSALTRFGIFKAGVVSAEDPKYTVVPQRERLAARS